MKTIDVKVYGRYRKHNRIPDYEGNPNVTHILYRNVPIFLISAAVMDMALLLEDVDMIHQNCRCPLLILTDRKRVLAVDPQGYSYPRYVCVIDEETAQQVLNMV